MSNGEMITLAVVVLSNVVTVCFFLFKNSITTAYQQEEINLLKKQVEQIQKRLHDGDIFFQRVEMNLEQISHKMGLVYFKGGHGSEKVEP